jgi:hypothetical protein
MDEPCTISVRESHIRISAIHLEKTPTRVFRMSKSLYSARAIPMAAVAVADGHECELAGKLLDSRRFEVAATGFGSIDGRLCESHLLTIN